MLTHGNLRTNALAVAECYRPAPQTMTLHVLPLSHSFGVLCMNVEAVHGLKSVILPRFDLPHVFHAIQEFRVRRFSAVPTMLDRHVPFPPPRPVRLFQPGARHQRRRGVAGRSAAGVRATVRLPGAERLRPIRGGPDRLLLRATARPARPGSSGRPIPGVEVWIRGPRRPTAAGGRVRRNLRPRAERHGRLLERPGSDAGRPPRRLAAHRRRRPPGRGRLPVHHRPAQGHHHQGGGEHLAAADRGGAAHAPGRGRGRGHRLPDPTFGEEVCAVVVLRAGHSATEAELREHAGQVRATDSGCRRGSCFGRNCPRAASARCSSANCGGNWPAP